MSMHIMPVYFTNTGSKKRKVKKKTASLIEAERQHEKFLKKMGVTRGRSSVGLERRPVTPEVVGSSPIVPAMSNKIPVGVVSKKDIIPHNFTIAPAYNKGEYQVISREEVKDIGR